MPPDNFGFQSGSRPPGLASDFCCQLVEEVSEDGGLRLLHQMGERFLAETMELHTKVVADLQQEILQLRTLLAQGPDSPDQLHEGRPGCFCKEGQPDFEVAAPPPARRLHVAQHWAPPALAACSVEDPCSEEEPVAESLSNRAARALKSGKSQISIGSVETWKASQTMDSLQGEETGSCAFGRMNSSQLWEGLFCVFIMLNTITIGLEAHFDVQVGGTPPDLHLLLVVSEHIFTAIFTIELLFRVYRLGIRKFCPPSRENKWHVLDAVVVALGIYFAWFVPLLVLAGVSLEFTAGRSLIALRTLRVLRLLYIVRKVELFHEVWVLIQGMYDSMRVLFWTIIVIFFITYVFAVFGLVLLGKSVRELEADPATNEADQEQLQILAEYLCGLGNIMVTLIQVLTLDSHTSVLRPVMKYVPFSWIYFYAYISLAVLVLLNLVTAIIVENALTSSRVDEDRQLHAKEMAKQKELEHLKHLFYLLDVDGDGILTWDEFEHGFRDAAMSKKWMLLDFAPADCQKLFNLLDTGDGKIDAGEFFEGLAKMKGPAQSRDIWAMRRQIEDLKIGLNVGRVGLSRGLCWNGDNCGY
ncbi:unnamed protein product [Polarella glacialis]|uniref:EF-hand domain-containing protein n=1 Tax=Polarella glacialis TaxID=89957 RepID=A0A813F206_POLGL|nr:unnamed protein product [Polarella glacialis]